MPKKLDLYMGKDLAELNKLADTSSFSNQKLSQSSICTTILKMYDEAHKHLKGDPDIDEERSYVFFMRFVELAVRMRKTKLYITDKTYVDSLITAEKVKKALDHLDTLKQCLAERYQALKPVETVAEEKKSTTEAPKLIQKTDINLKSIVEKALITCREVVKLIEEFRELNLMMVDCRSEIEFNSEKISFEFIKNYSPDRVTYINIPSNLIESFQKSGLVIWKLESKVSTGAKEALQKRNSFDYVIIFDLKGDIDESSNVILLKNAFFKFDKPEFQIKNEPMILEGGWQKWLFFYPAFKEVAIEVKEEEKEIEKPKVAERKAVEKNKDKLNNLNEIDNKENIEKEINLEPMNIVETPIVDDELKEEPKEINLTNGNIEIPIFNKPAPMVNRQLKPKFSNEALNTPATPPVEPKPRTSLIKPDIPIEQKPMVNNENIRPIEPRKPFVPPPTFGSTVQFPENKTGDIFTKIYKPVNRFANRPIEMPMMNNAKVRKIINPATGIMTYVYQSGDESTPKYTEKEQMPDDVLKNNVKNENESKSKERKEPLKLQSENTNANNNVKNALKRVASTPNIKDSEETSSTNSQQDVKPSINRQTKPRIEPKLNNMPSMLADLQPVWSTSSTQGLCGIKNLGNTCFMNSVLQCLCNCKPLRDYFVNGKYAMDINRKNPLGFEGRIAEHFASIVSAIWSGQCKLIAPKRFKETIGTFNSQFLSFEQQDAQEFLLFLLDGLHEDLNKVSQRPKKIPEIDNEKMDDSTAAHYNWQNHMLLNNSIIVDLFQGQFKSTLLCLSCNKKSVKFEAFMYLTLPVPSAKCTLYVSEFFLILI